MHSMRKSPDGIPIYFIRMAVQVSTHTLPALIPCSRCVFPLESSSHVCAHKRRRPWLSRSACVSPLLHPIFPPRSPRPHASRAILVASRCCAPRACDLSPELRSHLILVDSPCVLYKKKSFRCPIFAETDQRCEFRRVKTCGQRALGGSRMRRWWRRQLYRRGDFCMYEANRSTEVW